MTIEIPNYKSVNVRNIICDFNGTIAKDGKIQPKIKKLFSKLTKKFDVYVVTADTFGSVEKELKDCKVNIYILKNGDHTQEKADFVASVCAGETVAIGNGNNDVKMLRHAAITVAVMGPEGCSKDALLGADIICKSGADALGLLLEPKRLIATLRR